MLQSWLPMHFLLSLDCIHSSTFIVNRINSNININSPPIRFSEYSEKNKWVDERSTIAPRLVVLGLEKVQELNMLGKGKEGRVERGEGGGVKGMERKEGNREGDGEVERR